MKYLKIPMDRVGVLIGHKGETKKDLEERTGLTIDIDSKAGEVVIDDHEADDPLMVIKTENIIKAIGRGFSPEKAMVLMKDESDFFVFDLSFYCINFIEQVKKYFSPQARIKRSNLLF